MNHKRNIDSNLEFKAEIPRFAACVRRVPLLSMEVRTARRAPVSESSSHFHLSAGCHFRDRFMPVSQNAEQYKLYALRNFSRESSARANSKQHHLEIQDAFAPKL